MAMDVKPVGGSSTKADINVTPLVDVCLVLLIIFMVVTPLLQKGVDVALPETEEPGKMPDDERHLQIGIKADGKVFVGDDWLAQKELLTQRLTDIYRASPDKQIMLKADRRLPYKDVREVMRSINDAGFRHVGLVTMKTPELVAQ